MRLPAHFPLVSEVAIYLCAGAKRERVESLRARPVPECRVIAALS